MKAEDDYEYAQYRKLYLKVHPFELGGRCQVLASTVLPELL